MRVVLDTNVLFAAFVTHGVCAGLYEECLLQADSVVSDFILDELADRLVTKGKFTKTDAQEVAQAVRKDAHSVSPATARMAPALTVQRRRRHAGRHQCPGIRSLARRSFAREGGPNRCAKMKCAACGR